MDISVTTWILFLLPVNFAFATFLPVIDQIQEKPLDSKYFDLMRNMAILKLRLQAKGYGPEYLLHGSVGKSSEENHGDYFPSLLRSEFSSVDKPGDSVVKVDNKTEDVHDEFDKPIDGSEDDSVSEDYADYNDDKLDEITPGKFQFSEEEISKEKSEEIEYQDEITDKVNTLYDELYETEENYAKSVNPMHVLKDDSAESDSNSSSPGIITIDNDTGFQFSEMEILNMIPVIIAERKEGKISEEDESILKEMFGDLWPIIEEEAIRQEGQEMNPVLKALLQSQEVRQHKRESPKDNPQNDISGNTVSQINNRKSLSLPRRFLQAKLANLSPQQRLMRVAAVLIRSWYEENQPRKMRSVSNHMKTRLRRRQNRRKINNLRKNLRSKRHNILEDASEELYLDLLSNYLQTASSEYNDSDSTASSEESYDE